jgi:hypothetical protein
MKALQVVESEKVTREGDSEDDLGAEEMEFFT